VGTVLAGNSDNKVSATEGLIAAKTGEELNRDIGDFTHDDLIR
jgi:hypothetical protein